MDVLVATRERLRTLDDRTLHDGPIDALAVGPDGWWALSGHTVLHDGREVGALEGPDPVCIAPVEGGALVGTEEARLFRIRDTGIAPVPSFDEAPGREEWYTPWGGPPSTRTIATAGGAIYVSVHVGGILRSEDGGASWTPTGIDIDADVHQVRAAPDGRLLAAAAVGLAVSEDGGDTWTVHAEGLHSTYARAVAAAGDGILLTACDGPQGGRSIVYRWTLGAGFEPVLDDGFEGNIDTGLLDAHGDTAVVATPDGGVYLSSGAGRTWERVAEVPSVAGVALAGP